MAKPFTITGIVHEVLPLQTFNSGFTKRTVIIVDDPTKERPSYTAVDFTKDRVAYLDAVQKGEQVDVSFYTDARSWTNPSNGETRWFSSLTGTSLTRENRASQPVPPPAAPTSVPPAADASSLPF